LTDREIQGRVGKTPLDVGADRIARAAHRTLLRIRRVADETGRDLVVPLRAEEIAAPREGFPVRLLETYPAGWFVSEGIDASGYRPKGARDVRDTLLERAFAAVSIDSSLPREGFTKRADSLDALVCLFAGVDALMGRAPDLYTLGLASMREQIRREGWIWCKSCLP
jgi:hypothetical protein